MEEFDFSEYNLSDKEELVLKSAIQIFARKGFSGSTTKEIAVHAGVSEGTVFKYFKTKKGILRSILMILIHVFGSEFVKKPMEKIFDEADQKDLKSTLKSIFYDRLKHVDRLFPMAKVILVEALIHDDIRNVIYDQIISRIRLMFEDFYTMMSEKGLLRKDVSPDSVMRAVFGNFALLILQKKIFGEQFNFSDLEGEVDQQIDLILHGISVD